jgi:hypothetical protein
VVNKPEAVCNILTAKLFTVLKERKCVTGIPYYDMFVWFYGAPTQDRSYEAETVKMI